MKISAVADKFSSSFKSVNENESWFTGVTKEIICQMLSFLGGVLLASINDFGSISPFGVAYTASAEQKYLISAGLGSAAGYILTQDSVSALRYIAAIVTTAVLTKLFDEYEKTKKFGLLPSCITFLTLFLTSMIVLVAGESGVKVFLLFLGEAALGFAAAYFLVSSRGVAQLYNKQGGLTNRDLSTVMISACLLLLSLSGITLFSVSFARIIAVMAILLFSYIFKETGGAISGIAVALTFSMNGDVGAVGFSYAVAGLLSGVFSYCNKIVPAAVFLSAYSISFIFGAGGVDRIYLVVEAAVAVIIFMAVPSKYIRKAENLLVINSEPETNEAQRQVIMNRLKSASAAVGAMSQTVKSAASILETKNEKDTMSIYSKVQDTVCNGCNLFEFCWTKNFRDCKAAFDEMNEVLKNNEILSRRNTPQYLLGCCVKSAEIVDYFNKTYIKYVTMVSAQDKIEKIRRVTADQFGGICDMLSELSEEFGEGMAFDELRAKRIEEILLSDFSIGAKSVVCLTDADNRLKIEFTANEISPEVRENELKEALETICARKLDVPVSVKGDNTVTVCFCEQTKYRINAAASKLTADSEKLSGDSFESFYDGRGNYIVVLSDGMGSGIRAAIDSSLAAGMMAKLLKSGFSYGSSLRLVNSALLLKSKEESLATLDVLCINLYTGKASFYKAGAAKSLIKRKAKLLEISVASMPVGILKDAEFSTATGNLNEEDVVIMASDGAFEYSGDAVRNALAVTLDEDIRDVSEMIVRKSKAAKGVNRCDDITVIALRVVNNF